MMSVTPFIVMLNVIMPSVFVLNVVILSAIMQSVVKVNVFLLNVMAPFVTLVSDEGKSFLLLN
jgi:hypothetical protein